MVVQIVDLVFLGIIGLVIVAMDKRFLLSVILMRKELLKDNPLKSLIYKIIHTPAWDYPIFPFGWAKVLGDLLERLPWFVVDI